MNYPRRIIAVRHGQSIGNVESHGALIARGIPNHRFALTALGVEQAKKTGIYLKSRFGLFDIHRCSTFLRTQQTLANICPDVEAYQDARLNEHFCGPWHTMGRDLTLKYLPWEDEVQNREGYFHYRAPGGLSFPDLEVSLHGLLLELRIDAPGKDVLLVTHGGTMLALWRMLTRGTIEDFERKRKDDCYRNCEIAIFESNQDGMRHVEDVVEHLL